jgi:catechol 2,3-dioxygenase-like lactoylglutathione lyase family enzyme
MFSHVVLGANDLEASKTFYDAIIGAVGGNPGFTDPNGRVVYVHNGGVLLITKPIDGQPATCANGGTIGFAIASPEQADAWHAAGVAAGGTTCEDPPGERPGSGMYLAYLRDPAGNKLCGLHRLG